MPPFQPFRRRAAPAWRWSVRTATAGSVKGPPQGAAARAPPACAVGRPCPRCNGAPSALRLEQRRIDVERRRCDAPRREHVVGKLPRPSRERAIVADFLSPRAGVDFGAAVCGGVTARLSCLPVVLATGAIDWVVSALWAPACEAPNAAVVTRTAKISLQAIVAPHVPRMLRHDSVFQTSELCASLWLSLSKRWAAGKTAIRPTRRWRAPSCPSCRFPSEGKPAHPLHFPASFPGPWFSVWPGYPDSSGFRRSHRSAW